MLQSLILYVEIFMGSFWRITDFIMKYNCILSDSLNFQAEAYAALQMTSKQAERYQKDTTCFLSSARQRPEWSALTGAAQQHLASLIRPALTMGAVGQSWSKGMSSSFIYWFFKAWRAKFHTVKCNCCLLRAPQVAWIGLFAWHENCEFVLTVVSNWLERCV